MLPRCSCHATARIGRAQVVRFQTTVGNFDMVLNPTNNPVLQGHVDNMLEYVETATTGAAGSIGPPRISCCRWAASIRTPSACRWTSSTRPVARSTSRGEPAAGIPGLSNTVGTVSLALSGAGTGGTNQDSGSSSFFVNLTGNTFLDADFTVFAAIPDMTTINNIMALMQTDLTPIPISAPATATLASATCRSKTTAFRSSSSARS